MSCSVCQGADAKEIRAAWGCDGPTDFDLVEVRGCYRCLGTDAECEVCGGDGRWWLRECPNRFVGAWTTEVTRYMAMLLNQTPVLPVAGGLCDQAAVLLDAIDLLTVFRGYYRKPGGADADGN